MSDSLHYNEKYKDEVFRPLTLRPHGWSTTRYDDVYRLLPDVSGGTAVEIGCGAGHMIFGMAERFEHLVGVDLSDVRIALARKTLQELYPQWRDKIQFEVCDADKPLPFPDGSVPLVVACAVIEHVPDLFAMMDELARICKPGGHLIVTVPNIAYVKQVKDLLLGRLPLTGISSRNMAQMRRQGWDGYHLHYFTKQSLAQLLQHVGFLPEQWTGDGRLAKLRRWCLRFVGNLTVRARRQSQALSAP